MQLDLVDYIYDGTFEGLLTTIYYSYSNKSYVNIYKSQNYIESLINNKIIIKTEDDKFRRVYNSIRDKLSYNTLKSVYYLYLSDIPEVETLILKYIKLCYKYGVNINLAKNNDTIILVDKYYRRVSLEAHRYTGFVRFQEIGNFTFYASIEPDHNILPIIESHFVKRFSDQKFIIHDLRRELALVFDKNSSIITTLSKEDGIALSSNSSDNYDKLWQEFYNSVNIAERYNPNLQKRLMPTRYWKHLTELKDK